MVKNFIMLLVLAHAAYYIGGGAEDNTKNEEVVNVELKEEARKISSLK